MNSKHQVIKVVELTYWVIKLLNYYVISKLLFNYWIVCLSALNTKISIKLRSLEIKKIKY